MKSYEINLRMADLLTTNFQKLHTLISIKGASVCRIFIVTCVPEKPSLKSEEFQMAECRINIKPLVEIKGDGVPN